SASDSLICAEESWIKWQMFFDGWNDGTVDRLGSSFVNKSWNGIWVPQAKFISGVLNPTWVALQNQHPNLTIGRFGICYSHQTNSCKWWHSEITSRHRRK
ncbi:MAG: hypothetical protein IPO48_19230, partial [Saprospiraceae bacterium]|nr:hypothetical protein [Saprospiraceae bacterium]